jgi:hypothetical protein
VFTGHFLINRIPSGHSRPVIRRARFVTLRGLATVDPSLCRQMAGLWSKLRSRDGFRIHTASIC